MSAPPAWPPQRAGLLPPGTLIKNQYRLTGFLGAGAFGSVYLAVQLPIEREVAVKVLRQEGDEASLQRFIREAQAAARISHPNIVTVHDFGVTEEGRPFLVMERLVGASLAATLDERGPLSLERALALFVPCLEALAEAHRLGIVHKDLKPSNLFLANPGTKRELLKVVDFGIARVSTDAPRDLPPDDLQPDTAKKVQRFRSRLTDTGESIGTPQYLAPEYIEQQLVTPALDVYQVGLILAEALSGAPVIQLEGWWPCVLAHLRGELPIPREVQEGPLGPIIAKATSLDPALRYADAAQLQAALEGVCLRLFGGIPSPGEHAEEGQPSLAARPLARVTTQPRAALSEAPTALKPDALTAPKPDALAPPPKPALKPSKPAPRRWLAAWVVLAVGLSGCGCLGVSLFFSTDTLRAWLRERNTVTAQRADEGGDEPKEDSPKADEPPHKADKPPKKGKGKTPKAPPKPAFDARQAMVGTWQIREIDTLGIRQPGDGATLTVTPATLSYRFYLDIENQPYTVTATTDKTVSFRVQEDDSTSDALFELVNPDEAILYADESKAYLKRLR